MRLALLLSSLFTIYCATPFWINTVVDGRGEPQSQCGEFEVKQPYQVSSGTQRKFKKECCAMSCMTSKSMFARSWCLALKAHTLREESSRLGWPFFLQFWFSGRICSSLVYNVRVEIQGKPLEHLKKFRICEAITSLTRTGKQGLEETCSFLGQLQLVHEELHTFHGVLLSPKTPRRLKKA